MMRCKIYDVFDLCNKEGAYGLLWGMHCDVALDFDTEMWVSLGGHISRE